MRIIFGNAGTGMAHGPLLAQMLAEMAENDPSIVGVVGLALNSAATADTIKALGADGLPMIAVTLTADNVPENRRSITRSTRRTGVKPSNAWWISSKAPWCHPNRAKRPNRRVPRASGALRPRPVSSGRRGCAAR